MFTRRSVLANAAALTAAATVPAFGAEVIKIGNTFAYSGPASSYGTGGKTLAAYFKKVNAEGGIHGRQIDFISYDDAYSPPKTVEQIRRLVEQDEVDILFQTFGTANNLAIRKYCNTNKIPQLFVLSASSKFNDPHNFPWTTAWQPSYFAEGKVYGKYIRDNIDHAKIAVLYQNDDFGKDYLNGLKQGLGDKSDQVAATALYEIADPTVDSQVINLQASGANVFLIVATSKFAAQAIKKSHEIGWDAQRFLSIVAVSVGGVLTPAGLDASKGIISATYLMDPSDPQWATNPDMLAWRSFMSKWYPDGDQNDSMTSYAWAVAQTMAHVLEAAGPNAGREAIMHAATHMDHVRIPMLLPGITLSTSDTNFGPIESMRLMRFNGQSWTMFGDIINVGST
ncbi:amino acid/amide ABC transporter substrate-binding protein (HAAT family) [Roseiarcus fermentans]|uniref:Amino acid/amide ABC transporter substrate-binding protein (HAAT family) n=1 Tax=Roseiarcus fermentans TaxID=1473586 RepID=A0A366F7Z7_9HYPH|nr:ABC transporter substrate-binding protein [Roseiarcus fermentans]RBP09889.1 amino acid/amide ABC transporter substrate-binding protein (HAAT family) [Roseiarcus fermentans]